MLFRDVAVGWRGGAPLCSHKRRKGLKPWGQASAKILKGRALGRRLVSVIKPPELANCPLLKPGPVLVTLSLLG